MRNGLREITNRLGIKATVAGIGSVFLIYFMDGPIENYGDLMRNNKDLFVGYRRKLIERGILKMPLNLKRSHLSLAHTADQVAQTLQSCEDVLKEMVKAPSVWYI